MPLTHFPNGVSSFGAPVIPDMYLGKVWGNSFFVDGTDGSDSNSGEDRSAAKVTIQAGLNVMSAGDRLYVRDGAYTENLTISTNRIQVIGESISGLVVTGAADATDTVIVTGNEVTMANMGLRSFDTGADISLINLTSDGFRAQHMDFSGGEYQIENVGGDYCYVVGCHFITPDDVTDGACIRMEDANQCKILYSGLFVDADTEGIIHHDADNLEIGWCNGVGDDDTGASGAAFVLINGADATSQLSVHNCNATLFGAMIAENSTAVAAHGLGTSDLPTTATVDTSIEIDAACFGNSAVGCTLYFDSTGL
ncbi:MAG: hypothetical protein GY774_35725 [Planctomycetes bacterium]|nr:hypothetical protein [Planctomycetota bacterium]